MLQADPSSLGLRDSEETSRRIIEVIEVLCEEDGELYTHHLKDMVRSMEGDAPLYKRPILQEVMEGALVHMRNGESYHFCVY